MAIRLLSFPNPGNEVAARLVAAGVMALSVVELATARRWLLIPLAYGTASSPGFSPGPS